MDWEARQAWPLAGPGSGNFQADEPELHPWRIARDRLNHLANQIISARTWRAKLVVAYFEEPPKPEPPPWYVPTPPRPRKLLRDHYSYEPPRLDEMTVPATFEEAGWLFALLHLVIELHNWERAGVVYAVSAPWRTWTPGGPTMPWSDDRLVTFKVLTSWRIIGISTPARANELWLAWTKAVRKGKARQIHLSDSWPGHPDMPFPRGRAPRKKRLTVAQTRARREYLRKLEAEQYRQAHPPPPGYHWRYGIGNVDACDACGGAGTHSDWCVKDPGHPLLWRW